MNNEQEHKSPRESGEDSEDESEILEESPCGRWLKRREEVSLYLILLKIYPKYQRSNLTTCLPATILTNLLTQIRMLHRQDLWIDPGADFPLNSLHVFHP